ncbi:MAG: DNA polymerase III subunit gamma/tau [Bacteroidales bacterium]|nr:DNA polymerase III subunit gamma/tau [Bacteroidales bacterium]
MDNFVVSARKYRPITFDSVVGQKSITSTLQNAIRTNTLAQAFLFCGPRGVGKTTCARIMAKTINCMNPTTDMEACDECESCRSFNSSNSFNIYELDAASNNSVDDIRSLVDQVRIPPQLGKYKVYIIDEVHMLSQAAFNAFLKTLEEPPAYAKFILATTEKHKIIPTILSRCQIFDFKRITTDDISKHLQNIAFKENITAEDEALNVIAQKADGALRDALSIFDQMVSFSGKNLTYKDVISNLNVLDYDYYFRMVDYILNKDNNSILLLLNNVVENGFDIQHFIQGLATHLRNLLLGRDQRLVELMEVSRQLKARYIEQAQRCSQYFLLKTLDLANQCDLNFRNSNNKRLHIEICLMKMCYVEGQQLAANSQQPMANTQQPIANSQQPIANSQQPQMRPQPQVSSPVINQQPVTRAQQPIANTQQPIANSQQPTANTQQPTANTQQPIANSQQPTANSQQPTTVRMGRLGRTSTISITAEEPKKAEVVEEVWNNPFTQEQLTAAWNAFVEKYQNNSPVFVAGIKNAEPRMTSPSTVSFKIDNVLVVKDQNNMYALHEHLKNALHNNQFVLKEEVVERPKEVVLYTDKQKFEKIAGDNPNVANIKESLNLQLDI